MDLEREMLIQILNVMYNDNLRQMHQLTTSIQNLQQSNNQIRELLVRFVDQHQNQQPQRSSRAPRTRRTTVIEPMLVAEYTIPRDATQTDIANVFGSQLTQLMQQFLDPVEVYPTTSQIETATRTVRFSDLVRPINTQCPISMEDFAESDMVTLIRPCGHVFHTEPLMQWFRSHHRCPVCRYDIRDYIPNVSSLYENPTQSSSSQFGRSLLMALQDSINHLDLSGNQFTNNDSNGSNNNNSSNNNNNGNNNNNNGNGNNNNGSNNNGTSTNPYLYLFQRRSLRRS